MVKGKLILICQSGGEFVTKEDGTLSYAGGEANAVNVNSETQFDDLKLKLAEMCNLEYTSMSIKYFLPGNRRILITLKNDKDLKRMTDFHGNSVTADIYAMGTEGFNRDALNMHAKRETGIKLAESVDRVVMPATAANSSPARRTRVATTATNSSPARRTRAAATAATETAATATAATTTAANSSPAKRTRAATRRTAAPTDDPSPVPVFTTPDSVVAVDATAESPTRTTTSSTPSSDHVADYDSDYVPRSAVAADAIPHSQTEIDTSATPADTVKKRRRTASWKIGVNGPTIVSVADDDEERRSGKKSSRRRSVVAVADDMEQKQDIVPTKDDVKSPTVVISDDGSLEKLIASWRDGISCVGQKFDSVHEFRDALQKYAIAHRFGYKWKKNDTDRASGICVVEGCSWGIHATWVPDDQSFTIKKLNNLHTCGGESCKSAHPTKNWLVSIIKERLRVSPHQKPKEIVDGISRDTGIELSYSLVLRGIEDAREQLQGLYEEAYNQLPWFCEKIVETNPGSFTKLVTSDEKKFQCLFLSFHASICGFQNGCRPLLFLEATSLKSKNREILLTATAVDGNDGFFPVAFAIVDVENDDNWRWFLEQLKSAISTSQSITFVSAREKNLKKSVLEVFENSHHGYSMYHLIESFNKNLKGPFLGDGKASLPGNLLAAAHEVRLGGFKKYTEKIKQISSQAYDWVMQIEPEYWTSSSFKGERYNQITQNAAKSYTTLMQNSRELPIIQKIEGLVCMMIDMMNSRRVDLSNWSTKLTPLTEKILQEETLKARALKVLISSDTIFEVRDDSSHVVDIGKWDCTCLGWKQTGLPCCHAIAVFNTTGKSVYDYCSRYFTVDNFRLTYSESISPVPVGKPVETEEADSTVHVLPPSPSRAPIEEEEEQPETEGQAKRTVTCRRCKEPGHNKKSCKATL